MEPPPAPPRELITRHVYDAAEVDRFTRRLQQEIEELHGRLAEADRRTADGGPESPATRGAEVLLGRALLNAQRTADDAIADAERQAQRISADAHRRASEIIADAQRRADEIIADAQRRSDAPVPDDDDELRSDSDDEARRIVEQAHRRLDAIFANARRSPELGSRPSESWSHPAERRGATRFPPPEWPHSRESTEGAGQILELRPDPGHSDARGAIPAATAPGHAGGPSGTWLRATGTDLQPTPIALAVHSPTPLSATGLDKEPPTPSLAPRPRPAFMSSWRERWRLARDGSAAFNDDFFGRSGHLESLNDGSYVDGLRDRPARRVVPPGPQHFRRSFRGHGLLMSLLGL